LSGGTDLNLSPGNTRKGNTTLDYSGSTEEVDATLTVKAACTKAAVEGVECWIDKVGNETWDYIGKTNASGQVDMGVIYTKKTYDLKLEHTDYTNNREDTIKNDSFAVTVENAKSTSSSK
jgi:hypothetical protein